MFYRQLIFSHIIFILWVTTHFIQSSQAKEKGVVDVAQFVVKREGNNTLDCKIACTNEILLKCHYFLYLETPHTCLLSSTDHPSIATEAKTIGLDPKSVEKFMKEKKRLMLSEMDQLHNLKTKLNDVTSQVNNLQDMKAEMDRLISKTQLSQFHEKLIRGLGSKIVQLSETTSFLKSQVSDIVDKHSKSANGLKLLQLQDRKVQTEVDEALNRINSLQAYMGNMKKEDDTHKNKMDRMSFRQDQMDNWMKQLNRRVDTTHFDLKSNPAMIKVLHNQKTIAESLKDVNDRLNMYDNKQRKSDNIYDRLKGQVIQDEGQTRSLAQTVVSLNKDVRSVKDDVKRIEDPQSSPNMERSRLIVTLSNEMELLKRVNEELQRNLKLTRTDLVDLVKDLVNVKLDSQSNRAGITAIALAHKQTQNMFEDMTGQERDVRDKIRTMEDVYKRILEVVQNLEIHQVKLQHEVLQFDNAVHKISQGMRQLMDKKTDASLANKASELGVALSKMSLERLSKLKEEKLTPVKQLLHQKTQELLHKGKSSPEVVKLRPPNPNLEEENPKTKSYEILKTELEKRKEHILVEKKREEQARDESKKSERHKIKAIEDERKRKNSMTKSKVEENSNESKYIAPKQNKINENKLTNKLLEAKSEIGEEDSDFDIKVVKEKIKDEIFEESQKEEEAMASVKEMEKIWKKEAEENVNKVINEKINNKIIKEKLKKEAEENVKINNNKIKEKWKKVEEENVNNVINEKINNKMIKVKLKKVEEENVNNVINEKINNKMIKEKLKREAEENVNNVINEKINNRILKEKLKKEAEENVNNVINEKINNKMINEKWKKVAEENVNNVINEKINNKIMDEKSAKEAKIPNKALNEKIENKVLEIKSEKKAEAKENKEIKKKLRNKIMKAKSLKSKGKEKEKRKRRKRRRRRRRRRRRQKSNTMKTKII